MPGNPPPAIYDRYGYGGLSMPIYDLGCWEGLTETWANTISNLEMSGITWIIAVDGFLNRVADADVWGFALFPAVTSSQELAQRLLWNPGGVISTAIIILIAVVAWRGITLRVSKAAKALALLIGVLLVGHYTAFRGTDTIHWMHDAASELDTAFESNGGSRSGSDTLHREIAYQTWLVGMFGDADSPIAAEYGPRLFDCKAYRWDDPQTAEKEKEKQECFHITMDELHARHPVEANYARGGESTSRLIWTSVGLGSTVTSTFWSTVKNLSKLIRNLMIFVLVIAGMFIVPLAIFRPKTFVRPLFDMLVGFTLRAAITSVIAQLYATITGALLGAGSLPWLVRIILIGIVFVVTLMLAWRHHKISGEHAIEKRLTGIWRQVEQAAVKAAGNAAGLPPQVTEQLGDAKGLGGKGKEKPNADPLQVVIPQRHGDGWRAPALPGAGMTGGVTPQPAGNVAVGALRAGPLLTKAWPEEKTGVVPVGALGPGATKPAANANPVLALPAANRPSGRKRPTRMDGRVTGTMMFDPNSTTAMPALDVEGWVAPPRKPKP